MRIIDHQSKFIRYFDHLDPPFYFCNFQSTFDHLFRHAEMTADRDRSQRIIHAERSRNVDLHIKIHQPRHMIGNAEISRSADKSGIHRPQIIFLLKSKRLHFAGCLFEHIFKPRIVSVGDSKLTLFEQQSLTAFVIFKIRMLVRADVVFSQIGENPDLKRNAGCPVQHQPLRGYFHHNRVTSGFHHLGKIFLDRVRFRRRICRRDMFLSDDRLDRSDQSYLASDLFEDRPDHIGCCRLPLCPGDPDDLQLICRIAEICRRHQSQCIPGVLHADHGHIPGHFHLFFHDQRRRALIRNFRRETMSVRYRAADTYKHTARLYFPRVIDQRCDRNILCSLYHFIF